MLTPEEKKAAYALRNQHPNYTSPERRRKIGAALAERWKDPAFRAKMTAALKQGTAGRPGVRVTIDGVNYHSIKQAAEATGRGYS
uniref:hypothetical protein n=1 Tax=Mesomycoplasma ovipneumoniae TaxID=29562 RepID=UPI0030806C94